ncbi:MAG: formamidopyrimidine-DNA glycosylase [Desulfobulbus propionicus]|nr:MAG: formamidopyrimidine-DNA glycosylase [Desulfobulbus propionicus]
MPELPEVEVTRRGLLPHLTERRIVRLATSGKRLRLPVRRKLLQRCLIDAVVTGIERRAKYLLFRIENGATMVVHLGMTGKLGIFPATAPPARHDHLRLTLDNGLELRFNDSRRFGSVQIWSPETISGMETQFEQQQGLEPLDENFTPGILATLAANRHLPIKQFLMNSRLIAGIGNIYANESLFTAGIHPLTPACKLQPKQWTRLVKSIRTTLRKAIDAGGTTISDFISSSGQPGYFQLQLAVYQQDGTSCRICGKMIQKIVLGGRATYFCAGCQKKR